MTTAWTISATAERVALDPKGRAETTFTVTNFGPVDQRLVVDVVPGERTDRAWFAVIEPQRVVQHGGSVSVLTTIGVPAGTPPGQYWLAGRAYSGDRAPEETSVLSNRVSFEVAPAVAARTRNVWPWIVPVAVLLAIAVGVVLFLILRDEPAAAPEPAALTVFRTGALVVPEIFTADLDEVRLATSETDGDLYFEWISDRERYLTPTNAATFAVLDRAAGAFSGTSGGAQEAAQACAVAATTADRVPVGELGAGDLLCVRTGEGRLSVLTIFEPVGPSPTQLRATATTYES